MGFGVVTQFIDHFTTPLGTESNYSATTDLHALQTTAADIKPSPVCSVFIRRFLETASNSGDSSVSRTQVVSSQIAVQSSPSTE